VLDTRTPSVARAYDHLLGGGASFAADQALAGRLVALYPRLQENLLSSRAQVADSVARVARQGVDQYLDVGAGLPTRPSVHSAARALLPAARVVYIDRDPGVVTHGTALVPPGVRYHEGDLTEPEALLAALDVIDLSRPVCLVLALIVAAIEPATARAVVGVLVKALPPGSYLVATVGAGDAGRLPDSVWAASATEADLAAFFGGLDLLPPGITRRGEVLGGTGVKPRPAGGGHPGPGCGQRRSRG
jgi:SAM-dependent methyltransferase